MLPLPPPPPLLLLLLPFGSPLLPPPGAADAVVDGGAVGAATAAEAVHGCLAAAQLEPLGSAARQSEQLPPSTLWCVGDDSGHVEPGDTVASTIQG